MLDHRRNPTEAGATPTRRPEQAGTGTQQAVSQQRRGILRAAISAAPVIATLPSGEAMAAGSALQCVINEQLGVQAPPAGEVDPLTDNYARISGSVQFWLVQDPDIPTQNTLVEVYHFVDANGDQVWVYGDNATSSKTWPTPGTWFDTTTALLPFPNSQRNAEFLYLYNADVAPINDKTQVSQGPNPTPPPDRIPTDCTLEGITWPGPPASPVGPSKPVHCIYPMAVQSPQIEQNLPNNVPLTHSCLTSFQNAM
ncbi:hypothetical protein [uncultured Thiohalocapsa sp.]|uniref:hypothetical protein n=1 Tax=uncultured Thiohalocapsa sp. TaxID=768990 RepID=UPI0025D01217|nr:hypothetical protein [uncultured Thiohalocapsa sp.]